VHLDHTSPTGAYWRRDDRGRDGWVLRRRDAALQPVLATRILDDLESDPEVLAAPADGWQDFCTRLAQGLRRAARARPEAVPGLLSMPPAGSPLLPPLTSATWAERFLAALTVEGFTDAHAVAAYQGFTTFMSGHLLLELTNGASLSGRATVAGPGLTSPVLRRLAGLWDDPTSTGEFEAGLAQLLERFEIMRTAEVTPTTRLSVAAAT
jgi:hypothetical protein